MANKNRLIFRNPNRLSKKTGVVASTPTMAMIVSEGE